MAELAIVLAPTMEQQGVTTASEISRETLADRLIQEVAAGGGNVIGRTETCAWVHTQP
jgi:hypothetical protein